MKKILISGLVLLNMVSLDALAGTDPVSWTVTPAGGLPAQTMVGNSYVYTYTLTNNSPAALTVTTPDTYSASTVNIDDRCNNQTLSANGGTCNIYIGVQPARTGTHTINT